MGSKLLHKTTAWAWNAKSNTGINTAVLRKTFGMRFTGFNWTMAKDFHPDDKKMTELRIEDASRLVATSCDCPQTNFTLKSFQIIRMI
jgi:hypothetical protein